MGHYGRMRLVSLRIWRIRRSRNGSTRRPSLFHLQDNLALSEDGKQQEIVSLDVENTDSVVHAEPVPANLLGPLRAPSSAAAPQVRQITEGDLKDRRLILLFFDLTSMQPEEVARAAKSALEYVDKQMSPSDVVSVVSLSNSLTVNLDFTADREAVQNALQAFD